MPRRPRPSPPPPPPTAEALLVPLFDGFPYLATRIVPGACHLTLLPPWTRHRLLALLEQLDAPLVLRADEAHYRWPGTPEVVVGPAPRATAILTGRLLTPEPCDPADLEDRPFRLQAFRDAVNGDGGYLFGDLGKGGRAATADELEQLRGRGPDGVPLGLRRCPRCGDWQGACLDPNPDLPDWRVPVHCRCDNVTRCARCLAPFRERRVWGNEYRESDGHVWHWPGFMALEHRCPLAEPWDTLPEVTPSSQSVPTDVCQPVALVYGEIHGSLVFAERWRVDELVAFRRARTWGEFRLGAPTLYDEATASRDEIPDDTAVLDPCDISGYQDGDFPWFLQQLMLDLLPEPIQETYGTVVDTYLNGPMLTLDDAHASAIVEALEDAGFACERNQDLIDTIYA